MAVAWLGAILGAAFLSGAVYLLWLTLDVRLRERRLEATNRRIDESLAEAVAEFERVEGQIRAYIAELRRCADGLPELLEVIGREEGNEAVSEVSTAAAKVRSLLDMHARNVRNLSEIGALTSRHRAIIAPREARLDELRHEMEEILLRLAPPATG